MKNFVYILPFIVSAAGLVGLSFSVQACYTLKQGMTMLGYLHKAVPLESLLNQKEVSDTDKQFVNEIKEIRRFAIEDLGLKETKNYTKYVALNRDYLAAVVSASKQDSFTRYEWNFPVVGKVPYKGFFNVDDAKKEAEKLKQKELDVWIRPVDAFSTLGWFQDPLYSFMKEYSTARLADIIIHESFHATLFLKNAAQFNEELAEFIGTEGARLYIAQKFGAGSKEYNALFGDEKEQKIFIAYLKQIINELDVMYKSDLTRDAKLKQKDTIIQTAQKRFADTYQTLFSTDRYYFFSNMNINNAYLELYRLYHDGENRLNELYIASGSNLPQFIAAAKKLHNKTPPLEQLEKALLAR